MPLFDKMAHQFLQKLEFPKRPIFISFQILEGVYDHCLLKHEIGDNFMKCSKCPFLTKCKGLALILAKNYEFSNLFFYRFYDSSYHGMA